MSERNERKTPTGTTVALIGYMGSGKSTVGRLLARDLDFDFVDLDLEIEHAAGMAIPEIFSTKGESGFRDVEHDCLKRAAGMERAVVSCGGGVVIRPENREILARVATVLLEEDLEVLYRRTRGAARPLRGGGFEEFRDRYSEREKFYRETAHLIVHPEGRRQAEIAHEISEWTSHRMEKRL